MGECGGYSAPCVSMKLRQGESPTAWQAQEFRNVSLPSTVGLQKAVLEEVKPQSAVIHNICARHKKLHTPSRGSHSMSLMEWDLMDCIHTTRLTHLNMGAFPNCLLRMLPCLCQSSDVVWGLVWRSVSWPNAKTLPGAACCEAGYVCSAALPNSSQLNIIDTATGTN